jgi:arylsulfatase A-like enzyme
MLTGLPPQRHRVLWNRYQPERGFVRVPTVFELAKRAGLRTAMVFAKEKLKHLAKPGTVEVAKYAPGEPERTARTAVGVLEAFHPHLLFVHFSDPDRTGHEHGWGYDQRGEPPSPEYLRALERCDQATRMLVDALRRSHQWSRTLFILTADHGGHHRAHGSAMLEDVYIPWIAAGGLAPCRGRLKREVRVMDTAATALQALGLAVPSDWEGKPVE